MHPHNSALFAGGSPKQMEKSVTDFKLTSSMFDVAVISVLRWLIVFTTMYKSEQRGLERLVANAVPGQGLMVLALIMCSGSFIFAIIKVR